MSFLALKLSIGYQQLSLHKHRHLTRVKNIFVIRDLMGLPTRTMWGQQLELQSRKGTTLLTKLAVGAIEVISSVHPWNKLGGFQTAA